MGALLVLPALQLRNNGPTSDEGIAYAPTPPTSGDMEPGLPPAPAAPAWKDYPIQVGPFTFPDDEGFHPNALEEWWYVNGHLLSSGGNRYDFMVCFYKHGILAASLLDVASGEYLNHSETFLDIQRETGRLGLRYGPNELFQIEGEPFNYMLKYRSPKLTMDLRLEGSKAPLVVNGDGTIRMGRGTSYYYSLTDLSAEGALSLGGRDVPVTGRAWMDRQWGFWSPTLDWDWYSIKLDNGMQVLVYKIYEGGAERPFTVLASAIDAQGTSYHFNRSDDRYEMALGYQGYWRSPATQKLYSSGWRLTLPALDLDLDISPVRAGQETLFPADETPVSRAKPFWEGACEVFGSYSGRPVSGRAFVETTYDYGQVRGDLVIIPKEYIQDGDHSRFTIVVENRGGHSLDNVEVRLTAGSPYGGGKILVTYHLNNRQNSTYYSGSLPNLGETPLYLFVDPDNRTAETDEVNNIVVAVLK